MSAAIAGVRQRLLDTVAARVPDSPVDCVRVGIDGVDGAGKTVFANDLADTMRATNRVVIRASADDFHQPRAVRYRRGRDSPQGFWLDSYDYPAVHERLLKPLGPAGSRWYQLSCHNLDRDQHLDPSHQQAPPGAILVFDGLFLHRDELVAAWDLSVFLQVPFTVSVPRMASRDGSHPDPCHPSMTRYVEGQRLYFAACQPWDRADLVVDATDLDTPVLMNVR